MVLAFDVLVEEPPTAPVFLEVWCGDECEGRVDMTDALTAGSAGEWRTVTARLARFGEAGADLSHITAPFVLSTEGSLALRFADVRVEPAAGGDPPCE